MSEARRHFRRGGGEFARSGLEKVGEEIGLVYARGWTRRRLQSLTAVRMEKACIGWARVVD